MGSIALGIVLMLVYAFAIGCAIGLAERWFGPFQRWVMWLLSLAAISSFYPLGMWLGFTRKSKR